MNELQPRKKLKYSFKKTRYDEMLYLVFKLSQLKSRCFVIVYHNKA